MSVRLYCNRNINPRLRGHHNSNKKYNHVYVIFASVSYHNSNEKSNRESGVSGNSRSRPFSGIRASDSRSQSLGMSFSFSFPFPKVGNAFLIPVPVPKIWVCNIPFPFPLMGMDYHVGNRMGMEFKSWDLEGF